MISSTWDFLSVIIGPLIGAFAGVVLGVIANELWRRRLARHRKLFFKNLLLTEINRLIKIYEEDKYELLPIDGWSSLLNSGDIALFKDDATKLNETYSEIQWYNSELKILRATVEREYIEIRDSKEVEPKTRRSEILRKFTSERKTDLLEKMLGAKKLLNQMDI